MRIIVTYETQHGSAKKVAETIAGKLNTRCINVDTPFEAEDPTKYDCIILCFGFRGPYTAQLTKLFLSRMKGKLDNKHVVLVGEGLFSEKEFPVVANQIHENLPCASFHTHFIKGQLRVNTLTSEEQVLLGEFSKITGMKIVDMGELNMDEVDTLANEIVEEISTLKVNEDIIKTRWVCTICGYVHEGDNPPEKCPTCQQPSSVFKKMD